MFSYRVIATITRSNGLAVRFHDSVVVLRERKEERSILSSACLFFTKDFEEGKSDKIGTEESFYDIERNSMQLKIVKLNTRHLGRILVTVDKLDCFWIFIKMGIKVIINYGYKI